MFSLITFTSSVFSHHVAYCATFLSSSPCWYTFCVSRLPISFHYITKSSRAISCVNVELASDVSENVRLRRRGLVWWVQNSGRTAAGPTNCDVQQPLEVFSVSVPLISREEGADVSIGAKCDTRAEKAGPYCLIPSLQTAFIITVNRSSVSALPCFVTILCTVDMRMTTPPNVQLLLGVGF